MDENKMNFNLNINNFQSIPFQAYTNDFTFIVNGKRYPTNRIFADILSPIVRNMHFIDGSQNEYSINIHKKFQSFSESVDKSTNFQEFLNLAYFHENNELDSKQQEEFAKYFYALGNIEEYVKLQPEFKKSLKIENALDRLFLIENIHSKSEIQKKYRNDLVEFIAGHFEYIDKVQMRSLQHETIDEILQSKELSLVDEDSLLNFTIDLYQNDRSSSFLFQNVNFENLSRESVQYFFENFAYEDIDRHIWHSLYNRLFGLDELTDDENNGYKRKYIKSSRKIKKIKKLKEKEKNFIIEEFSDELEECKGMIHFLNKKSGGNIHDNGTVEVWSNSIHLNDMKYHPKNLFDFKKDNFFASDDTRFASICIDFKDRLIQPRSYKMKTCKGGENSAHLKNWVFEVSNDNSNWIQIDRHENDDKLRGSMLAPLFKIDIENGGFYRYIRIRQTGESWYTKKTGNYFILREFEIYGKLKEVSIQKQN